MATAKPMLHLAQFLVHGPTYHSLGMWRHPKTDNQSMPWDRPELYQHIAKVCERGLFDMVFFADLNYIADTFRGSLEPALRYATQAPEHDPIPLLSYLGAVTKHIGLAATFQPFVRSLCERRRGTLVGIASVAGIRGLPGHAAYCSSKAAVISYCESLRGECRPFGVRVVTLSPGYVDTPLTRGTRYSMPFLMQPDAFSDRAFRAIEQGVGHRVIPWQMGVVAGLLRLLPNAVLDRLLAGQPRKQRRGETAP